MLRDDRVSEKESVDNKGIVYVIHVLMLISICKCDFFIFFVPSSHEMLLIEHLH